ncbi:MAG: hypothetical protein LC745_07965 [Planctomycetia bacterium]|nr:hypothetical protein [Planctomycetia bacterium]
MRTARTLRLATVLAAMLLPGRALAGYTPYFSEVDVGAGPSDDPVHVLAKSTNEALLFKDAASRLGTYTTADLGAAVGSLRAASLGDGLIVTLGGVKADPTSLVTSGVVTTNANTADGFSVSSPNGPFLRLTPDATNPSVTASTATFTFGTPVQAFGVYLTGLGTSSGSFELRVYDGGPLGYTPHVIQGDPLGGAQFVGFTEPGAGVTRVDFQMTGFSPTHRDIVGFDGIGFVTAVPEPSTFVLVTIGGLVVLGPRYSARLLRGR